MLKTSAKNYSPVLDQPLHAIVRFVQARYHDVLRRHDEILILLYEAIQVIVVTLVLLISVSKMRRLSKINIKKNKCNSPPHGQTVGANFDVVARFVLQHAQNRPQRLVRLRVAILRIAEHHQLVALEGRHAAHVELGLECGHFYERQMILISLKIN